MNIEMNSAHNFILSEIYKIRYNTVALYSVLPLRNTDYRFSMLLTCAVKKSGILKLSELHFIPKIKLANK